MNDGHQWRSMWATTRSVPRKWSTFGRIRGSYIVSVMSRMRATFFPSFTICRIANGRPRTHMLRWTPRRTTFSIPRWARRFHVS